MAETIIQVSSGSGPKLHGFDRVVGANTVIDDFSLPGEYPYPSYTILAPSVSVATINDHVLQIMAGSSLNVRIRRIRVWQNVLAGAANTVTYSIYRLSTAGTGGTAYTPSKLNTGDPAAGATAMSLPTVKGTEGVEVYRLRHAAVAAQPVATKDTMDEWVLQTNTEPLIIPAGTANGIALRSLTAVASAAVVVEVEFVETAYL